MLQSILRKNEIADGLTNTLCVGCFSEIGKGEQYANLQSFRPDIDMTVILKVIWKQKSLFWTVFDLREFSANRIKCICVLDTFKIPIVNLIG